MAMTERHFPKGLPRRRLGQPLLCPITGRMVTGEECLRTCGYAHEDHGFVDCRAEELRPQERVELAARSAAAAVSVEND